MCRVCVLHSGQSGVVCVVGFILCRYACRIGDLPVRSCASVRRVCRGSDCSVLCMGGAGAFSMLLCRRSVRCFCTMFVCIVFMFSLMVSSVV